MNYYESLIGKQLTQWSGGTKVRQVRVVSVCGDTITVRALNGPLAGCEYPASDTDLEPRGVQILINARNELEMLYGQITASEEELGTGTVAEIQCRQRELEKALVRSEYTWKLIQREAGRAITELQDRLEES